MEPRPLPAMSLAVVGMAHANRDKSNRQFEIAICAPGDPIDLICEPKNPHDPSAVAVFSERGTQLGYLRANRCGRIGALIREGRELVAVFQGAAKFGAWIRVGFEGEVPAVPAVVAPAGGEPEFYPDEEWPDD